jgi:hypothetical protein
MKTTALIITLLLYSNLFPQDISTYKLLTLNEPKYKKNPKVVVSITYDLRKDSQILSIIIDSLNEERKIISTTDFNGNKIKQWSRKYKYDSTGKRLIKEIFTDFTRQGTNYNTVYYYEQNKVYLIENTDSSGNGFEIVEVKYNNEGFPIWLTKSSSVKYISEKAEYFYNSNTVVVSVFNFYGPMFNDTLSINSYKVSTLRKRPDILDKNGDTVKKIRYSDGHNKYTITEMEYTYDRMQNWIECKYYQTKVTDNIKTKKKLVAIERRQIFY